MARFKIDFEAAKREAEAPKRIDRSDKYCVLVEYVEGQTWLIEDEDEKQYLLGLPKFKADMVRGKAFKFHRDEDTSYVEFDDIKPLKQ
jgi:hypothetical protein